MNIKISKISTIIHIFNRHITFFKPEVFHHQQCKSKPNYFHFNESNLYFSHLIHRKIFFYQRNLIKKVKKKSTPGRDEIVGTTSIFNDFHSTNLDNYRNIIVWLPPGYRRLRNVGKRYPVLYMHDGQNIVDPKTSFNGMDWRVDETAVKLIKAKKIKKIIVVGIYNTPDRLEEYSDTKKGNLYIKFICEELKPFIDNNFRTLTDRESTGIMGSSMGGLISFIAGWKQSEVFSMVGCMSSSFYYNDEKVFDMINPASRPNNKMKFYIDHGEDGLIRGQKMFNRLSELGYVIGKDIDYFYAPDGEHNENAWADRMDRPLLFFFGTKKGEIK